MAKKKITEIVEELLTPFLDAEGYELYNCEFVKEGKDWFLRVFADMAAEGEYIGTADCEKISRHLSDILDKEDIIEQNYYLEVSSPGMDRVLVKPEHYIRYTGREIKVKLYKGKDGTKNIQGVLQEISGGTVKIKGNDGRDWELELSEIAKANLVAVF